MMTRHKGLEILSATAAAVALAGCSSSDDGPTTGQLTLSVSDGPVHDATEVCLEFSEIQIKKAGSPPEVIGDLVLQQVNLLDFQGMNKALLVIEEEVEAGEYEWVRLGVNAVLNGSGGQGVAAEASVGCSYGGSYVYFEDRAMEDGTSMEVPPAGVYNAYVPSGEQRGFQVNGPFIVAAGGSTEMTAEFNLQKMLTEPPGLDGNIIVRPSIRLVNTLEVGAVTGIVATDLAEPGVAVTDAPACEPSVFVFADGTAPESMTLENSVASAMVTNEADPPDYAYTVGYLEPGDYDLAFTCDGERFDPGVGDVTIVAGETEKLNFPVEETT